MYYVNHAAALKNDGTVVAEGDNDYGQCNVSEWNDIVAIAAGSYHTVGLKADGTVVVAGRLTEDIKGVNKWENMLLK